MQSKVQDVRDSPSLQSDDLQLAFSGWPLLTRACNLVLTLAVGRCKGQILALKLLAHVFSERWRNSCSKKRFFVSSIQWLSRDISQLSHYQILSGFRAIFLIG